MTKPHLYWIFAPVDAVESLRNLAVQIGDGGEAERLNFSIPLALVSAPNAIVGYGGCSGPVTVDVVQFLEMNVLPSLPAGVHWVRLANEADPAKVERTSEMATQARIDAGENIAWDMPAALARIGMAIFKSN